MNPLTVGWVEKYTPKYTKILYQKLENRTNFRFLIAIFTIGTINEY